MVELPEKNTLIVAVGPSGSGKTKFFNDYINDEKHQGKYEGKERGYRTFVNDCFL